MWISAWTGCQSVHPRHVAVKVLLRRTDDQPCQTIRCPSPWVIEMWSVCTYGRINFFHSVLYVSMLFLVIPLDSLDSLPHWGLDAFPCRCLNVNPHLSYMATAFHSVICPCCVSTLDLSSVCVSIFSFVCVCQLGWSCVRPVFISRCDTGGVCRWLGDAVKMSLFGCALLYDTVYTALMTSHPRRGLLLCLPGIRNDK